MTLRLLNLALLILFPIAWTAPLASAGLLPYFDLDEISVLTGIASLWHKDIFLAIVVTLFAIVAPITKIATLALIQFGPLDKRHFPILEILGKLAMADVFLIALYIVLVKGVGIGRVETGWGLYLFTFCVLVSMLVTHLSKKSLP